MEANVAYTSTVEADIQIATDGSSTFTRGVFSVFLKEDHCEQVIDWTCQQGAVMIKGRRRTMCFCEIQLLVIILRGKLRG